MQIVQRGTEEQNCFFRNDVKNYTEFYTDCKNFQSFLINQKLNVKLVMKTSWRSVLSALLHARNYANLAAVCNPRVFQ